MALLPKRSLVRPLVQDGVVVTPVRTRNVPISSSSLTQGTTTRTIPVQEIVLAVAPQEVAPLAEAMDLKYEIICVARSGRPAPAPSPAVGSSSAGAGWQVFGALAKAVLSAGSAAAPGKTRPAPDVRKPTTTRTTRGPATVRWRWTSRPDWTPWPRPGTWR